MSFDKINLNIHEYIRLG